MTFPEDVRRVTGEHEIFFVEDRGEDRTTVLVYGRRGAVDRLLQFLRKWTTKK